MDNNSTIVQWNCNSFKNKPQEIALICQTYNPTCICLQETKSDVKLKGYTTYQKEGTLDQLGRRQGGVAILVKDNYIQSSINLNTQLQAVATQITLNKPITICNIYFPPSEQQAYPTEKDLDDLVQQLPQPFFLLGDFNAHNVIWGSANTNAKGKLIESLIDRHNLCLLNDGRPTYYSSSSQTWTHIDLTLCSPSIFLDFSWNTATDMQDSDHYPLLIQDDHQGPFRRIPKWKLYKADWEVFRDLCLDELEADDFLREEDPMESFTNCLQSIASRSIPKTSGKEKRQDKPWFNDACRQARKERREAERNYKNNMILPNLIAFKRAKAKARCVFRLAMKQCWRDFVSKINSNTPIIKVWNMIRKIKGKKQPSHIQHLECNGEKIMGTKAIADRIGETLEEITSRDGGNPDFNAVRQAEERTPINFDNNNDHPYNAPFSLDELETALNNSNNSSAGPDEIPYGILKQLPETGKECLLKVMNHIWETGDFPPHWKEATVLPIPKPGKDLSDPKNYRPIALTSCICKTMERMANSRLVWYLESNDLLRPDQCGFRKGRSTLDALSSLETYIRDAFINGQQAVAIFFDLEKAYDTTWQYGILKDLKKAGLEGQLPRFIKGYLSNRQFRVRVNGVLSDLFDQESGVPQGGILSVTLFLLKINDIIKDISKLIGRTLYVDDFLMCFRGRSMRTIERILQNCIKELMTWAKDNGFRFSINKTCIIHFHYHIQVERQPDIYMDEAKTQRIPVVEKTKFLGIMVDRKLCFKDHMKYLRTKCSKALNLLRVVAHPTWGGDQDTLLKLYRSLVLSQLDYGLCIYGAACPSYFKMAEAIQNQGLRICLGAFRTTRIESLQVEAGELPLSLRRDKLSLQYAVCIAANPNNPAAILLRSPQYEGKYEERKKWFIAPLRNRVQKLLAESNITLDSVRELTVPEHPPWLLHKPKINLSLAQHKKAETSNTAFQAAFNELRDSYQRHETIYTDGSHIAGKTGSAAVKELHVYKERLPDEASIYTAEAHALFLAQDHIETSDATQHLILSDSLSVLTTMSTYDWSHPMINSILERHHQLTEAGNNITYAWVAGHVGIRGNDQADSAAKDATNQVIVDMTLPATDLKRKINKFITNKWQTSWDAETDNQLQKIQPNVKAPRKRECKCRMDERIMSRLRMGHTRLTHSFLMKREPRPLCNRCQKHLTVKHFLVKCRHCPIRARFHQCRTLKDLFDTCKPETILAYVKELGYYNQL